MAKRCDCSLSRSVIIMGRMRIAIFGSRGFIGHEVLRQAPKGYELLILNRPKGDVRDPSLFVQALIDFKPDAVINLSALIGTLISSPPVRELFETNTLGALNVAYAAHRAGAKSHIFVSSVVVHGESKNGERLGRFSPFAPKHPYGASKASAEFALQQFSREQRDMAIVSLRPPFVIGTGTEVVQTPFEFVKEIKEGRDIKIFGDGLHEREFVSVRDVAAGIWQAAAWSVSAHKTYQPFFLTGNPASMKELAEKAVKMFGGRTVYNTKTVQSFSLITDPSESEQAFGWRAYAGLESMLDDVACHVGLSRVPA